MKHKNAKENSYLIDLLKFSDLFPLKPFFSLSLSFVLIFLFLYIFLNVIVKIVDLLWALLLPFQHNIMTRLKGKMPWLFKQFFPPYALLNITLTYKLNIKESNRASSVIINAISPSLFNHSKQRLFKLYDWKKQKKLCHAGTLDSTNHSK